ncbi:hypothetical protein M3197_06575 [Sporosarcina aquimarina]|uniref:hypothetical protein n=1 Tax=Sporosarcina aquimarina TaxID=114975 RepID=UPI00203DAB69|nr:hypothetical protein [Sporosarcina aquimarina]MCM3757152.1 hypothetical protein [Sporosarcina aquimarina]
MKIIFQAIVASLVIHVIYIVGMLSSGFIKTLIYKPDIETAWKKIDIIQSEVAFGVTFSPYIIVLSFVSGTLVCWCFLLFIQKNAGVIQGN